MTTQLSSTNRRERETGGAAFSVGVIVENSNDPSTRPFYVSHSDDLCLSINSKSTEAFAIRMCIDLM